MTYIVEFEVDGDAVSYTVKAENVLDAEEAAKEKLKADSKISKDRGSSVSSWEVKSIEHIPDLLLGYFVKIVSIMITSVTKFPTFRPAKL